MSILNLTQHAATPDQLAAGVVDLPAAERATLGELLTFAEIPTSADVLERASDIAALGAQNAAAEDREDSIDGALSGGGLAFRAMIGGAPWLMAPLVDALRGQGLDPVFAFSARASEEQAQPDGSVRKVAVFRHAGFVQAG